MIPPTMSVFFISIDTDNKLYYNLQAILPLLHRFRNVDNQVSERERERLRALWRAFPGHPSEIG